MRQRGRCRRNRRAHTRSERRSQPSDADGDTLTYALGGADALAFAIDAATGQLATRPDYSYDHEASPSHALAVTAADGHGNQAEIALTVHVTNVLEPPLQPDPPTVAPTGIDALAVSWTAPPNTGRPDITGYNLRYSGSGRPFTLWSRDADGYPRADNRSAGGHPMRCRCAA